MKSASRLHDAELFSYSNNCFVEELKIFTSNSTHCTKLSNHIVAGDIAVGAVLEDGLYLLLYRCGSVLGG